jgi:hypothetical protein
MITTTCWILWMSAGPEPPVVVGPPLVVVVVPPLVVVVVPGPDADGARREPDPQAATRRPVITTTEEMRTHLRLVMPQLSTGGVRDR